VTRRRRSDPDAPLLLDFGRDAAQVLADAPAGEVLYEAPEIRKRGRAAKPTAPRSLGLPFGVRQTDGHAVCWSCGHDLDEASMVRAGPGDLRCPGCGAKLPFTE
jgi:hypothetical protein